MQSVGSKRRRDRLASFVALLALSIAGQALSAEWIEVHSDEEGTIEIDRSSLTLKANKIVEAWERMSYSAPQDVEGTTITHIVTRTSNDCVSRRKTTLSTVAYDGQKVVFNSNEASEPSYIVPDSVGETIFEAICIGQSGRSAQKSHIRPANLPEIVSCKTPGIAEKCGKLEHCTDNQAELKEYAKRQAMFGLKEPGPVNVWSCQLRLAKTVWESNCLGTNKEMCRIYLDGEITKGTAYGLGRFVRELVAPEKRSDMNLHLNSQGGDIDAAMEIGEMLREFQASASVGFNQTCASACVLVLAGASDRTMFGSIIIHRPFRADAVQLGAEEAQRQYFLRNLRMRNYLLRMNVSASFLEAMIAVPPEESRKLTKEELDSYGMLSMDPVYQEELDAKNAKELGITMVEWQDRKRRVTACMKKLTSENQGGLPVGSFEDCGEIYGFKKQSQ